MFKNYFKTAWRNLTRNKTVSAINVVGLVLGIGVTLIISLYVMDQLQYDQFHEKGDQIYRVLAKPEKETKQTISASTFPPMAQGFIENFPEVKNAVRFENGKDSKLTYNQNTLFIEKFLFADQSLFNVFSFELVSGNPNKALAAPFNVVVSESFAEKVFGSENPMDKTIELGENEYTVTGVAKDPPSQSSIQFDLLVSFSTLNITKERMYQTFRNGWGIQAPVTYLLLEKGTDISKIENQIPDFLETQTDLSYVLKNTFLLEPFSDQYLYSEAGNLAGVSGDIRYVYIFSSIAIIVLLIALFNYVNLTTAQYSRRIKEVGARKALGAQQKELIIQFLGESLLISMLAGILAIVLVELSIPLINSALGLSLISAFFKTPEAITIVLAIVLLTGCLGGAYPAYVLSKFRASEIISNRTKMVQGASVRKILTTFQYSLSIILLIGVFLINGQLKYAMTTDLGFKKDQVLVVEKIGVSDEMMGTLMEKIRGHSSVLTSSLSSGVPGGGQFMGSTLKYGDNQETQNFFRMLAVDKQFIDLYGLKITKGREFGEYYESDIGKSIIISEETARQLGFENPIGERVTYWGGASVRSLESLTIFIISL